MQRMAGMQTLGYLNRLGSAIRGSPAGNTPPGPLFDSRIRNKHFARRALPRGATRMQGLPVHEAGISGNRRKGMAMTNGKHCIAIIALPIVALLACVGMADDGAGRIVNGKTIGVCATHNDAAAFFQASYGIRGE